ncbi:MAG TPA: FGGY family carbohydrate kinase, partial [Saprospiraceae bacterium]|nr:FGGY family carbohydrate kinase [Saprospiraceae bacterium]
MYLLGYDIGSSSVKAALVNAISGQLEASAHYPDTEMPIQAPLPGWAEQHPDDWWEAVAQVTRRLLRQSGVPAQQIQAIGIAYQMHGLVLIDRQGQVLRPAIIWCDSRAVGIGARAFDALGEEYCLGHCFNSPGNFTASKLRWVLEHEPAVFDQVHHFMLPGDYIAYRMTGEVGTTLTGLSEGVMWDFRSHTPAYALLAHYGIPEAMLPPLLPIFGEQGRLTQAAAECLGLCGGIPVTYRAGDQPNNAFSMHALRPGEVAATGGTSGVVYAVSERPVLDPRQRVNGFAHVNYTPAEPYMGVLLCINGTGIQYGWLRRVLSGGGHVLPDYADLERIAASVPVGSEGLSVLPFGNGAERMLGNRDVGSHLMGLQFNRHEARHLYRAA